MADQLTPTLMDPRKAAQSLPPQDPRRALAQVMLDGQPAKSDLKGLPPDWQQTLVVACLGGAGNSHSALGRAFNVASSTIKKWMRKRAFAQVRAEACEGLRMLLLNPLMSEALRRNPEDIGDAKERAQNIDLRLRLLGRLYPTEFGATPHVQINNNVGAPSDQPSAPRAVVLSREDFVRLIASRPAIEGQSTPVAPALPAPVKVERS